MCMHHFILSSVTCLTVQYFSTLSHKRHDFRGGKSSLNTKCVFSFISLQLLSETFLILRRTERDVIKNVYWCLCQVAVFLRDFNEMWCLWTNFLKVLKNQIYFQYFLHKIHVAGSIPDGVTVIFHWHNPSGRTMAQGLTQPLTEMSTGNISWVGKGGRCVGLTTLPPSCADCLEMWEHETPGNPRASPGLYRDYFIFVS
jgi:hypothetical protein